MYEIKIEVCQLTTPQPLINIQLAFDKIYTVAVYFPVLKLSICFVLRPCVCLKSKL